MHTPDERYFEATLFKLRPSPKLLRRGRVTLEINSDRAGIKVCLVGDRGIRVICERDRSVSVEYGEGEAEEMFRLES